MSSTRLKTKIIGLLGIATIVIGSLVGVTLNTLPAKAADDFGTTLMKKVIANAMYTCYKSANMKPSITAQKFTGVGSVLRDTGQIILIPNMVGNTLTSGKLTCRQAFVGKNADKSSDSARGLQQLFGTKIQRGASGLKQLGWIERGSGTSDQVGCLQVEFSKPGENSTKLKSNRLCHRFDKDGKLKIDGSWENTDGDGYIFITSGGTEIKITNTFADGAFRSMTIGGNEKWSDIVSEFKTKAEEVVRQSSAPSAWRPEGGALSYGSFIGDETLQSYQNVEYFKPNNLTSDTLKKLTGVSERSKFNYTIEEKATLYRTYIQNEIDASAGYISMDISTCSEKKSEVKESAKKIDNGYVYHRSSGTWCVISMSEEAGKKPLNGFSGDGGNAIMKQTDLMSIVKTQAKDSYDNKLQDIADDQSYLNGTADPSGDNAADTTPPCFSSAESLGWIICPVIKTLSKALNGIYGYVESNFLMINSSLMDSSGGLHTGWTQFRDIANVIFVILIVLVILSQVTGIGISNYGIKKVLPRLIAVAILANLSFIICQLAVDLTNLLGVGLKQMFLSLSKNVVSVTDFTMDLSTVLFSSVATTGATVIATVAAVKTWELWLPAVLLFLLTTIISVLFFAIVLGVRQAGIIILIALAPAAIVCYALPNTQKLFDRWFKLFTSLLLVFPICGILMGGGIYASNLMLAAAEGADEGPGFFFTLVAMLMQVVPFFLVPSLIKNSLALAGNIGAKISNAGARLGANSTRAIRNTESFKDMQGRLRAHNAERFLARDEWREKHRFLGAPGRAMNRIGGAIRQSDTAIGRAAKHTYDQRRKRAIDTAIAQRLSDQTAEYAAQAPFADQAQRAKDAAYRKHINEMAGDIELANADIASDNDALAARHQEALAALEADQSDENLAAVQAYQNMMVTSDDGRNAIFDNLARSASEGGTQGLKLASQHLMRDHVKDIKPNNRDLFGFIAKAANMNEDGSNVNRDFETFEDEDHNVHYYSQEYGGSAIGGYDESTIGKADEGAIERMIAQAHNRQFDDTKREQLEEYTRKLLTSDTLHVQGKIAKKLNKLRNELGYGSITPSNASANSQGAGGGMDVPHDRGGASGANAQNAGAGPARNPNPAANLRTNPDGSFSGTIRQPGVGTVQVSNATRSPGGVILSNERPSRPRDPNDDITRRLNGSSGRDRTGNSGS